jgi:predicted ATPase
MSRATIIKDELTSNNVRLLAIYIETKNSVLVLLSEGEDQLGTLAASVPPVTEIASQSVVSSILLGDRNTAVVRMLAERLATKTSKIGLVSVHLRTISETEATPALIKLFERVTTINKAEQSSQEGESVKA